MNYPSLLHHAEIAAKQAGALIQETPIFGFEHKGSVDLVTKVDLASEEHLRKYFAHHTPNIPILAEEHGGSKAHTRWIIDPLDGTTNFAHNIPHYAVSIALEHNGKMVLGVVYDPNRNELFSAVQGGGAKCNGHSIFVSKTRILNHAIVGTGFPYNRRENISLHLRYIEKALLHCQGLRRIGSAALDLCYLAHGRLDVFWEFGLKPWDVAAGIVIIQEAGGVICDFQEQDYTWKSQHIVASNPFLCKDFCALLREVEHLEPN